MFILRVKLNVFIWLFWQTKYKTFRCITYYAIHKCVPNSWYISLRYLAARHRNDCFDWELSQKKTGFFKEQNEGFRALIHRVSLTRTCFLLSMGHVSRSLRGFDCFPIPNLRAKLLNLFISSFAILSPFIQSLSSHFYNL